MKRTQARRPRPWALALLVCCAAAAPPNDEESDASAAKPAPGAARNVAAKPQRESPSKPAAVKSPALRPAGPPPEFRGPDVTLIAGEERDVYEFRQNGQLRMIKVVPAIGKPYYLTPRDATRGFGDLEQADMLLAEWVLWEF